MFSTIRNISRLHFNTFNIQLTAKCSSETIHSAPKLHAIQNVQNQTFGQPTYQTHPHLIKEEEIIPGIKKNEFRLRRNQLMEKISSASIFHDLLSANPNVVIIPSASKVYMSDKIPYIFRQNTDFLYFTGCQEPDSILLLTSTGKSYSSILFMRNKDAHAELWDGPRTGVNSALSLFDVDQALPIGEFDQFLMSFLKDNKKTTVWYDSEDIVQPAVHNRLVQYIKVCSKHKFHSPKKFIHELRVIKSLSEINLMKSSCHIASAAISKTIEKSVPGISEHQLFATVDYESRMRGAEILAYPPVVACGNNANIIHYISNNQIVHDKEMVLMDAGCEYHGYTSDITRTWPVNGTFTPEQRILYEIVLDVQKTLIKLLKEKPSLDTVYNIMCELFGKRLQEEHIIPKHLSSNKLHSAVHSFCPHHVSHYLGMDVHDTSQISRGIPIQPGMIVTVEPGIYVNTKNEFAPPEFHNLGVRIEDDILIQENDVLILTHSCPKEVSDVEEVASKNQL